MTIDELMRQLNTLNERRLLAKKYDQPSQVRRIVGQMDELIRNYIGETHG